MCESLQKRFNSGVCPILDSLEYRLCPTKISGWITLDLAFSMEASLCNWTRYVILLRLSLMRSLVYDKD